ncbi:DEAD/DEAH box helicase family protein [Aceticella autotrophica]|uniref:Flagellar biosynthesis protein FlhF n=1 Tax=Aceticella autotrophica TaxID=2755338 RepID=A0A974Y4B1_9THEO|nr:DEAD/DEAH box helicase family protein [Aceticella autotrophica]QSZ26592.1 DEAD/DEAH box helicase family protein [Aceticella autotrophica]
MKVKRYIADNYQDALQKIKLDMGSNAIILHQNKIRNKGIKGFFQKKKVEVFAAVEENHISESNILKKDVFEIKMLLKALKDKEKDDAVFEETNNLVEFLLERGVDKELTSLLTEGLMSINNETIELLRKRMKTFMGIPQQLKMSEKNRILFIGPTGVGKTTTIAKIASNLILKENKKVILVAADVFRIAGVDQLKIYGDILGVPVIVVNNIFELHKAKEKLDMYDMVLIDTAGRSHNDEKKINELKSFVQYSACNKVYLCLSAATKSMDLKKIIDTYEFINNYSLIFTKLDETDNYSTILNSVYYSKKPLSYITNGQNVPDDIQLADIDIITKNILKVN